MIPPPPVFRFAPSPNGRLHLGHAYSALLSEKMAREVNGRLLLRIEDTDENRCTADLTKACLDDLHWLGIRFEEPVRVQSRHFAEYEAALQTLRAKGVLYPCFCSRKTTDAQALPSLDPDGQKHYGGNCRSLSKEESEKLITAGQQHGWRLNMQACGAPAAQEWGDVMIAKRRVGSSYHIAVVVDDAFQGVTHVVRGKDLEAATSIHRLLQRLLELPTPHYHHHELIRDDTGTKLAKSRGSPSLASLRENGVTPDDIRCRLGFKP